MTTGFSIGGIASGLDTSAMIRQLMDIERQPIVRFEQRQTQLRTVDAAWGEVVTKVSAFRSALDAVRRSDDWSGFLSATSSDESAVTVSATGGGDPGNLSATVTSLAARHTMQTTGSFASATSTVGVGSLDITSEDGSTVLASITTDAATTLADVARMIDDADVGVDAQVLKVGDGDHRLVLRATESGRAGRFAVDTTTAVGTASVLRAGSDATLDLGGGLVVTRSSNTITDLVEGVTIDLRATTTEPVEITSSRDTAAAADAVEAMVTAANDVLATLTKHTAYNPESRTAGALQGDSAARQLQLQLRSLLSESTGVGTITHGSQLGISLSRTGDVTVDRSALEQALADDFAGVMAFFTESYDTPVGVQVAGTTAATRPGGYQLQVDTAASAGSITGTGYTRPTGGGTTFTLMTAAGDDVTITLAKEMKTPADARAHIAGELAAAGVDDVVVTEDGTALTFRHRSVGSDAWFEIAGLGDGLDGRHVGTDLAGSVSDANGTYAATGSGSSLRVTDGPAEGMVLRYGGTATGALGTVTVSSGLGGSLDSWLDTVEGSGGSIQRSRDAIDGRIRSYDDQIEAFEARLELREATLRRQFTGLESALGQLQAQGQWLAGQLGSLGGGVQ